VKDEKHPDVGELGEFRKVLILNSLLVELNAALRGWD
jgi:hypothetical protein